MHRIAVQSISEQEKVHLLPSYKTHVRTISSWLPREHTLLLLLPSDGIVHSLVDSGQHPSITLADVIDISLLR